MKVLITGGSSGIGAAIAKELISHEIHVMDIKIPTSKQYCHIGVDCSNMAEVDKKCRELELYDRCETWRAEREVE